MKDVMFVVFDSNNPPKNLKGLTLYKFESTCQAQCTRRNKWFHNQGKTNYVPRKVELKLI